MIGFDRFILLPNNLRKGRHRKWMAHFWNCKAAFTFLAVKQDIIVSDNKDHIDDMLCWIFFKASASSA